MFQPMAEAVTTVHVFLVAGHEALRENLALLLQDEGMSLCGWATCSAAAIEPVPEDADVLVVALAADDSSDLALLYELASRDGAAPILALSATDDELWTDSLIVAGASRVVSNRRVHRALAPAIRELSAGRLAVSHPATEAR